MEWSYRFMKGSTALSEQRVLENLYLLRRFDSHSISPQRIRMCWQITTANWKPGLKVMGLSVSRSVMKRGSFSMCREHMILQRITRTPEILVATSRKCFRYYS